MATDPAHDPITPPASALRQSRSGRRSPSRATWVALLLSLAAILAAIGWPTFRRWQAIRSLEENGYGVSFTEESEWMTRWFGEAASGFREVYGVNSLAPSPGSIQDIAFLDEAVVLMFYNPRTLDDGDLAALDRLDNLRAVQLGGRIFSDPMLADVCARLPAIVELVLWDTCASQQAMEAVARLHSLEKLRIFRPQIRDEDFVGLDPLPNLIDFCFDGAIGDNALAWLAQSPRLTRVSLFHGEMTDDGLRELSRLAELDTLELGWCPHVTDAGFAHLEGLPNLRELFVEAHCVTPEFIESLRRMPSLRNILVDGTIADPALREILDREWRLENEAPPVAP